MYDHEEELIDIMEKALRSAEVDIEGIIEVALVGVEHKIARIAEGRLKNCAFALT